MPESARDERISLHPLDPEDEIRALLGVDPESAPLSENDAMRERSRELADAVMDDPEAVAYFRAMIAISEQSEPVEDDFSWLDASSPQ